MSDIGFCFACGSDVVGFRCKCEGDVWNIGMWAFDHYGINEYMFYPANFLLFDFQRDVMIHYSHSRDDYFAYSTSPPNESR